ncbi:hypothetical protein MPSEU_000553700 [Mayamaea pseudoterrestris]|nr:hypothetical protein MPSEU_000553700 [Mayamaea pseudoterrestris]
MRLFLVVGVEWNACRIVILTTKNRIGNEYDMQPLVGHHRLALFHPSSTMAASRNLTNQFVELRSACLLRKRRGGGGASSGNSSGRPYERPAADPAYKKLTAGGVHDLSLAEEGDIQLSHISSSPPTWVSHVQAVEDLLVEIQNHMDQLQHMHATRLGSVFGKDLANMEQRIEQATFDLTEQLRQAERLLQAVGVATRQSSLSGDDDAATIGANIQKSLAKRLQETSLAFRQSQRKYLAEVQTQKSGGLSNNFDSLPQEGVYFSQQQLVVVDDLTTMVQSRDHEISKIAQSIEELGTIFKELAVLVIDQGTILDRIDYNMEAVVEHTKTGVQQLEKAENSQRNARPLRCIVCLSVTIFVLLALLILKHHRW